MEPGAHRSRGNHRRRGHRNGGAREVLRADGHHARHRGEPPDAAPLPDGDGAPHLAVGRRRARGEGQGAEVAPHDGAADRDGERRARAVRARVRPRRRGARLPRGARRRPSLGGRDLRRDEGARRQLAVGRRPVLRAGGQAARAAGDRGRHPVQEGPPLALQRAGRRDQPQRPRDAHPARRGDRPALHLEGARPGDHSSRRGDGLPLRRVLRVEHARGLRAASARRHARRRHALHAPRRGRRAMGVHRPRVRRLGARGEHPSPIYAAGSWGPEQAEDLIARDGRRWRKP